MATIVDRLLLADDPLVERVLHVQQSLGLGLGDARDRDAGPHRDDLGDLLLVDRRRVAGDRGLPLAAEGVDLLAQRGLVLAELGRGLVVLGVDRAVLLLGHPVELALRLAQRRRRGGVAEADAAGGLVDEVDRLVGQVAVRDVADRQVRGGAARRRP